MAESKEWLSVKHSPKQTTVTVSLQEGNLSVRWTVKAYTTTIKAGVKEAREYAEKALADLRAAAR